MDAPTLPGLAPQRDPEVESESDGPSYPSCGADRVGRFRPGNTLGTLCPKGPCRAPAEEATLLLAEDAKRSDTQGWQNTEDGILAPSLLTHMHILDLKCSSFMSVVDVVERRLHNIELLRVELVCCLLRRNRSAGGRVGVLEVLRVFEQRFARAPAHPLPL